MVAPGEKFAPAAPPAKAPADAANAATPERIRELAETLLTRIRGSIKSIGEINLQARVLSMNAQIEAARAGEAGLSFGVVGQEMVGLSVRTQDAAGKLQLESEGAMLELVEISRQLASSVRGTRYADLALTNIDLIDRNLYERSCDVRWWATDASVVSVLSDPSDEARKHACERLGVILKAYTVYFDIVVADLAGNVVANGRPQQFASIGTNHADAEWFTAALATNNGDEFGFHSAHLSPLAGNAPVLVYSCKVCAGGDARGEPLGVLGVVFNWAALGEKVVQNTPLGDEDRGRARCCIVDADGRILADSTGSSLRQRIDLRVLGDALDAPKGYRLVNLAGRPHVIAHANSPGFETYATGWHSLIVREL